MDSNHRPTGYEPAALTAELQSLANDGINPVPEGRIELPTQGFSVLRSTTELLRRNISHYLEITKKINLYSCVRAEGLEPPTLSV